MSKTTIVKEAAERALADESERTKHLLGMAEKLVAGALIVTGYQLLNLAVVLESPSRLPEVSCFLALAALGLSMFLGFYSLRPKGHAGYPRGDKLWETLKPDNVSEDAAQEAVIHLLLKSREQNAKLNDAKARSLFWCGWLLFAGVLLAAGSQLLNALTFND
jgi:hypothetical protein